MSWTKNVECSRCGSFDWLADTGEWTCWWCHKPMATAEIADYHRRSEVEVPTKEPATCRSFGCGRTEGHEGDHSHGPLSVQLENQRRKNERP